MKRLRELMSEFMANPHDEEVKKAYFVALKRKYGEQNTSGLHPLMSREPKGNSNSRRASLYNSQSPNGLYPLERLSPQLGLANFA